MKSRVVHDAGTTKPTNLDKIKFDSVVDYSSTPRSAYAIRETISASITNRVIENSNPRLNIADGQKRPGTR